MGGPLTASDLQTHQHATECHSTAPVAPPLLACFVLTCALEGTVSNSAWVTRSHTARLLGQRSSPESKVCLFVWHHTESHDMLGKGCCAVPFRISNDTISTVRHRQISIAYMSITTLRCVFKKNHIWSCTLIYSFSDSSESASHD